MARVAAANIDAVLLGSVFIDLPYYGRLFQQLLRQAIGRDYLHAEWGDLLHAAGTGQFAAAILAGLASDPSLREEQLAFLLGFLCHYSADSACHPVINQMVTRLQQRDRRPPYIIHTAVERYQSWFYHREVLGLDIFGGQYCRKLSGAMFGQGIRSPRLRPPIWAIIRQCCLEIYGRTPTFNEVCGWLSGAKRYLLALSSPLGLLARPRGRPAKLRSCYYSGPEVDLQTPLTSALAWAVSAWQAVQDALAAGQFTDGVRRSFLQKVPDVDLTTGRPALPCQQNRRRSA